MNFALEKGILSAEQCRGIIRLFLSNWRPISLLNIDYKILTIALAQRIIPYLSKLIGKKQTGYVKGRYIGENIRSVEDIIEFCNESHMNPEPLLLWISKRVLILYGGQLFMKH